MPLLFDKLLQQELEKEIREEEQRKMIDDKLIDLTLAALSAEEQNALLAESGYNARYGQEWDKKKKHKVFKPKKEFKIEDTQVYHACIKSKYKTRYKALINTFIEKGIVTISDNNKLYWHKSKSLLVYFAYQMNENNIVRPIGKLNYSWKIFADDFDVENGITMNYFSQKAVGINDKEVRGKYEIDDLCKELFS